MKPRDLLDLLLLAALWGASFLFMRIAAPHFGAVPLIEVRVALAALFLLPWLAWKRSGKELRAKALPIFVIGVTNSALPFSLFAYATLSVTAGLASILNATAPLFGALVAYVWLRDKLSAVRIAGLAIGFSGVVMLVWGQASFRPGGSGYAIVGALAASLLYGISANYAKRRLAGVDPLAIATGSQVAAALVLLPPAIAWWPAQVPEASSWLAVIALAVACTGIAYILYFRLIAHVGPAKAIAVTFLAPAFGVLWGMLFLDETLTPGMVLGCAVILFGTALSTGVLTLKRMPFFRRVQ